MTKNGSVHVIASGLLVAGLLASGCADQSSGRDTVTQGIVSVGPSGALTVKYVEVPRADYERAVEAKTLLASGKITVDEADAFVAGAGNQSTLDASCAASSFWLHTGTNQTGPILCLARTGTAGGTSVGIFTFSDGSNGLNYQSYWAGSTAGIFHNVGGGGGPTFTAFQRVDAINYNPSNFPFLDQ